MKFLQSTLLLANVLALVAGITLPTTPAPATDVDVSKVDAQAIKQFRVYYCQHKNWGLPCVVDEWTGAEGACHKVLSGFRSSISSIGPERNIFCVLYHYTDCSQRGLFVTYPGHANLQEFPPINDDVKAMRCRFGGYPRLLDASEVPVME